MKTEDEPQPNGPQRDNLISLTDLIDEMDRASFRRSLANREAGEALEVTDHQLQAQPKSQG
jgi:hypothetical protein